MNTTAHTTETFEAMRNDDRWEGFGYIGTRLHLQPATRREADRIALERANQLGLSYEQLFEWANSKDGRWYADCCNDEHAARYLPSK